MPSARNNPCLLAVYALSGVVNQRTAAAVVLVLIGLLALVLLVSPPPWLVEPGPYDTANVTLRDENGTDLATVEVHIADTRAKRVTGLSDTDSLSPGEGMLFVHSREGTRSYVMRDMAFPLDIAFVDSEGTITTIHHAARDADGTFEGRGQYVLEVPRGWTNRTGVAVGDTVLVPDDVD